MPNSMEKQVVDGIIAIAQARTYISTNSIAVVDSLDDITEKDAQFIAVHAEPHERVAPNFDLYYVMVDVVACSHKKSDPMADKLQPLIYEVQAIVNTMTKTSLATASGLTIDGLVPQEGDEEPPEEKLFSMFSSRIKVALTFTFT